MSIWTKMELAKQFIYCMMYEQCCCPGQGAWTSPGMFAKGPHPAPWSQFHQITKASWLERSCGVQPSARSRTCIRLFRAPSRQALNVFPKENLPCLWAGYAMFNYFHKEDSFLISRRSLPWSNTCLLPLVLSPHSLVVRAAPPALYLCLRYWKVVGSIPHPEFPFPL